MARLIDSRRRARIAAMQSLFQLEYSDFAANESAPNEDAANEAAEIEAAAIEAAFQAAVEEDGQPMPEEAAAAYAAFLVAGVNEHRAAIDAALTLVSRSWKITRMSAIDRNILRLAVFELKFAPLENRPPEGAVIDEAVTIAKGFGTEKSGQFVNGVLSDVLALPVA